MDQDQDQDRPKKETKDGQKKRKLSNIHWRRSRWQDLSFGSGLVKVELSKDVKSGDKTDETETHNENNRRWYLQTWSFIRVESQHVVRSSSCTGSSPCRCASTATELAATHASRSGGGSTRSSQTGTGGWGGGGGWLLGLGGAFSHSSCIGWRRDKMFFFLKSNLWWWCIIECWWIERKRRGSCSMYIKLHYIEYSQRLFLGGSHGKMNLVR